MLQILTGRFFEGKGKVEARDTEDVLYSNLDTHRNVATCVGELRRMLYGSGEPCTYAFHYVNRYERASERSPIVLAFSDEAVDQFRALCCLWFRAIFHPTRAFVESLIHTRTKHVDRYFAPRVDSPHEEYEGFVRFMADMISLPREKYVRVIACVRAFCDSIEAVSTNFDVGYGLLVYLLEALSKASDESFSPIWEDFDEGQRLKIDKLVPKMEAEVATKLKEVLTSNPHLKLSKRFLDFTTSQVRDAFFLDEATGRSFPIRRSDLPRLLKNVYKTRSEYVHELHLVMDEVKHLSRDPLWEVLRFQHDAYLTYSGLIRLARHILISFISSSPKVETETYPWRDDMPGTIRGELAPEYWIWPHEGFKQEHARLRFSGVIAYMMDLLTKPTAQMLPLRPLVEKVFELLTTAKAENVPALTGIYYLYNRVLPAADAMADWHPTVEEIIDRDEQCRIEYLSSTTLTGDGLTYSAAESEACYREYVRHRHKANAVCLPQQLEAAVLCRIANIYLEDGADADFRRVIEEAILELPNAKAHQDRLRFHRDRAIPVDAGPLLGRAVAPTQSAPPDSPPECSTAT